MIDREISMAERDKHTELTENERKQLAAIRVRLDYLTSFLNEGRLPTEKSSIVEWFRTLSTIKSIVRNTNNDLSFAACLMAKEYLCQRFEMRTFDMAHMHLNASGLHIDDETTTGEHVVGVVRATAPPAGKDLESQQKKTHDKDYKKLNEANADYRFFFVTDCVTYDIMREKYSSQIPGVEIVLLPPMSEKGSPWLRALYDYYAPVRQDMIDRGISDEEVNADIDAAIAAVRAEQRSMQ
jgi:hypothetical protein